MSLGRPLEDHEKHKVGSLLSLFQSSLDPKASNAIALANTTGAPPSFMQAVTYTLTFRPPADSTLIGERISGLNSGLITFFRGGPEHVYRVGFIPGGTQSGSVAPVFGAATTTPALPAGVVQNDSFRPSMPISAVAPVPGTFGDPSSGLVFLVYNAELLVPHATESQVAIGPQLSNRFRQLRNICSMLCMRSTTTSAGFELNGLASAAAFADTRDVCQNDGSTLQDGVGNGAAFSDTAMQQSSITEKDKIINHKLQDGVVVVQGPDIPSKFIQPTDNTLYELHGDRADLSQFLSQLSGGSWNYTSEVGITRRLTAFFASPWEVSGTYTDPNLNSGLAGTITSPITVQANGLSNYVPIPKTQEMVYPQFLVDIPFYAIAAVASRFRVWVRAEHKFVRVRSDGSLDYVTDVEQEDLLMDTSGSASQEPYVGFSDRLRAHFNAGRRRDGWSVKGKYVGTSFEINYCSLGNINGSAANVVDLFTGASSFQVVATSIQDEGQLTASVVRLKELDPDQSISLTGVAFCQVVARASLATFTNSASRLMPEVISADALPLLAELFNGDSDFRRIWAFCDWREFVHAKLQDKGTLNALIGEIGANNANLLTGEAGGLFGAIGDGIGSFVDSITGNKSGRGAGIGSGLGSAVDHMLGGASGVHGKNTGSCGGVFGATGSAGGVFGSSSGTYGSASGAYNPVAGTRRMR